MLKGSYGTLAIKRCEDRTISSKESTKTIFLHRNDRRLVTYWKLFLQLPVEPKLVTVLSRVNAISHNVLDRKRLFIL